VPTTSPSDLNPTRLAQKLPPGNFGHPLHFYESCESTNKIASELARSGCDHGTTVLADEQTAGRGRRGSAWHSTAGLGLWLSVVIDLPDQVDNLPLTAACAVASAIGRLTSIAPKIKWPNDLLFGDRKVSGVMGEMAGDRAVLGIGINVNHSPYDFPDEIQHTATSIAISTDSKLDRTELLLCLLAELNDRLVVCRSGNSEKLLEEWTSRSCVLGRSVVVEEESDKQTETVEGTATAITATGSLIVDTAQGLKEVITGHLRTQDAQQR
jgi:BirA family biotin operon repressor/biotin-[acetyl-CoA-carboxylase] ligase